MTTTTTSPERDVTPLAVGRAMLADDAASRLLGMELLDAGLGTASISMTVTDQMVNGHGSCHGGLIFALADTAFATACNSYNRVAVGSDCAINYIRPGRIGDVLTASAVESALAGRSGLYDITVANQSGEVIAMFHGRSRSFDKEVIPTRDVDEASA